MRVNQRKAQLDSTYGTKTINSYRIHSNQPKPLSQTQKTLSNRTFLKTKASENDESEGMRTAYQKFSQTLSRFNPEDQDRTEFAQRPMNLKEFSHYSAHKSDLPVQVSITEGFYRKRIADDPNTQLKKAIFSEKLYQVPNILKVQSSHDKRDRQMFGRTVSLSEVKNLKQSGQKQDQPCELKIKDFFNTPKTSLPGRISSFGSFKESSTQKDRWNTTRPSKFQSFKSDYENEKETYDDGFVVKELNIAGEASTSAGGKSCLTEKSISQVGNPSLFRPGLYSSPEMAKRR